MSMFWTSVLEDGLLYTEVDLGDIQMDTSGVQAGRAHTPRTSGLEHPSQLVAEAASRRCPSHMVNAERFSKLYTPSSRVSSHSNWVSMFWIILNDVGAALNIRILVSYYVLFDGTSVHKIRDSLTSRVPRPL